jgi:hypothetical protein
MVPTSAASHHHNLQGILLSAPMQVRRMALLAPGYIPSRAVRGLGSAHRLHLHRPGN